MVDKEKPLLVQSDRTILLDLSSNDAENARLDIIPFAELVKSPEHMHTYTLSPLSLWNAISAGLSAEEIITRLRKWSRYDIDQRVLFFIEDTAGRYGDFILTEDEENTERLLLKVKRKRMLYICSQGVWSLYSYRSFRFFEGQMYCCSLLQVQCSLYRS